PSYRECGAAESFFQVRSGSYLQPARHMTVNCEMSV
ncbi:hypothetical protein AC249_AIPGENE10628, partial [Exaiptasia diaphana]